MSLFFKISNDGESIYIAKTLFSDEIDYDEFIRRARNISVNKFLVKIPQELREKIRININRIKEIDDMNLSFVGTYEVNNSTEKKSYACHYLFNERYYPNSLSGERLIEKAEKFYGKESMSEIMDKVYQEKITYLSGIKEITKEEYNKLIEEKQDLMKVVCLKKGKELIASIKK